MAEQTSKTNDVNTSTFNEGVLTKLLRDLTPEEIDKNFKRVKCLLRRRKFGKGNDVTYRYTATLQFHPLFEINFNLDQNKYVNVLLSRKIDLRSVSDSYTLNVYYLAVKSKRRDGNGASYQIKTVLSKDVRIKTFLNDLELSNCEKMNVFEFVEVPEIEDDEDARLIDGGLI